MGLGVPKEVTKYFLKKIHDLQKAKFEKLIVFFYIILYISILLLITNLSPEMTEKKEERIKFYRDNSV